MNNLEEILGFEKQSLQPYNYNRYLAVNPNLTVRMYEYLRGNHSEWKILCGIGVKIQFENETLKEVKNRKGGEGYKLTIFYIHRYQPEIYLALDTW